SAHWHGRPSIMQSVGSLAPPRPSSGPGRSKRNWVLSPAASPPSDGVKVTIDPSWVWSAPETPVTCWSPTSMVTTQVSAYPGPGLEMVTVTLRPLRPSRRPEVVITAVSSGAPAPAAWPALSAGPAPSIGVLVLPGRPTVAAAVATGPDVAGGRAGVVAASPAWPASVGPCSCPGAGSGAAGGGPAG